MLSKEQIELLKQPLNPNKVAHRSQSGKELSYIKGFKAIETANDLFGFGEWGYDLISLEKSQGSNRQGEAKTFYTAILKLTVNNCQSVTDVGVAITANDTPESHEMAIKGAVTDAMKRALRTFGEQFGNSLYDTDLVDGQPRTATQNQQRPQQSGNGYAYPARNNQPPKPLQVTNTASGDKATEQQIQAIKKIAARAEMSPAELTAQLQELYGKALEALDKSEASHFIKVLQGGSK